MGQAADNSSWLRSFDQIMFVSVFLCLLMRRNIEFCFEQEKLVAKKKLNEGEKTLSQIIIKFYWIHKFGSI